MGKCLACVRVYTVAVTALLTKLADSLVLSSLLDALVQSVGSYELLDHWQQGEFHHDIVLRVPPTSFLPGPILVVATNCNGGVKEVISLQHPPDRFGLWRFRCPHNPEFVGELPAILDRRLTQHWFDPCELLSSNARSELREEFRERQLGGGWKQRH